MDMAPFRSQIRFNTKMGGTDREAFGIKPRDTTPTVQLPPKSRPEVTAWHTKNHFEVLVKAMGHGADEDRRPEDAYGVRYVWQVGGAKPENGEDLGRQKFSRRTARTVVFKESDRGKTVYISACYENGKGETGPYAAIIEEIIA